MENKSDAPVVYFNQKQVEFYAKRCKISVALCARAFGKTRGIVGPHLHDLITAMPRSLLLLGCYSYRSIIKNIIPGICNTLDDFGYVENVHYWINKKPPAGLKIDRPFYHLIDYEDSLSFYNGTVVLFGSVQFGFHNSLSFDAAIFDEFRFLKEDKIDDIIPAIRGNAQHFGHLWQHGSQLYVSDKPDITNEKWLYDVAEQADADATDEIMQYQMLLSKAEALYDQADDLTKKKLDKLIKEYESKLNELRLDNVLYFEGSTFDNVTVLGLSTIKAYRKKLKDPEYARSVCNHDQVQNENTFYPDLGSIHLVDLFNKEAIRGKDIRKLLPTWDWDASVSPNLPLHIGCDWGRNLLCMSVGQLRSQNSFRIVSAHNVKYPSKVKDLVKVFTDYFNGFPKQNINFHYNHTAKAEGGIDTNTYAKEFMTEMKRAGWGIVEHYHRAAPTHKSNYLMWQKALDIDNPDIPYVDFSHGPCDDLIISMQGAGMRMESGEIKKDKRPEKNKSRNQAHATHLSESADCLLHGVCSMMEERGIIPSFLQR